LTEATKKATAAMESNADNAKELADEESRAHDALKKSTESAKQADRVLSEAKRQGKDVGGGGRGSLAAMAGSVADAAGAGVRLARYGFIGSELEQMSVKQGKAQFSNQEYYDYRSMFQGDAVATGRILSNLYGAAKGKGASFQSMEQGFSAGETVATGVGAATGARGIEATGMQGIQTLKGIAAGQTDIAAKHAVVDLGTEQSRVTWEQAGQYSSARIGIAGGLRGMGGGATYAGAMGAALNARGTLAGLGMDNAQQAQFYGAATAALGARGGEAVGAARNAGRWENAGYIANTGQYAQMLGAVAGAGGGTKDLESAMRNAVAAGLDSSKNMMQMVSGIAAVAAGSAAGGINTTGVISTTMSGIAQRLQGTGIEKNLSLDMARNAMMRAEAATSDTGMNLGTINKLGIMQQAGLTGRKALLAAQTSGVQLANIRSKFNTGDITGARADARALRLEDEMFDGNSLRMSSDGKTSLLDTMSRAQQVGATMNILRGAPAALQSRIYGSLQKGKPLSAQDRRELADWEQVNQGYGGPGGEAGTSAILDQGRGATGNRKVDNTINQETKIRNMGARSEDKQITAGQQAMDKLYGGFNKFGETLEATLKNWKPEEWGDKAQKASEDLGSLQGAAAGAAAKINELTASIDKLLNKLPGSQQTGPTPAKKGTEKAVQRFNTGTAGVRRER
jgi:hypothetical protein